LKDKKKNTQTKQYRLTLELEMDGKESVNQNMMQFMLVQVLLLIHLLFFHYLFIYLFLAAAEVPEALKSALKKGGRMV